MLTGLLIVGGVLAGQVEPVAGADLTFQVRRLVNRLDADELVDRVAAEKALIELGPDALNYLPEITNRTPPDAIFRLRRVRLVLQQAAAKQATQSSRVSLPAQTMPLSRVLAALHEQTGNQLIDFRQRWRQQVEDVDVDVEFEDLPFWQALDEILDCAKMTLYHYPGQPNCTAFVRREEGALPRSGRAAYDGIFRVEPIKINASSNLRSAAAGTLMVTLEISWEPRLTPISLSLPLADISGVDDQGNPVVAAADQGTLDTAVRNGVSGVEMEVPLKLPARSAERIVTLSGQVTALLPGRVEAFEFDDLGKAENVVIRKGGVSVVLQTVRKNVAVHEVRMILRFDEADNALESHRGWIYNNKAYLLDADGNQVEDIGYEKTRQTTNEIGFAYKFALDHDLTKYRFVYETPAAIVRMPVKYELKDIALP